ncbi:MAG TPA: hypothetical protein VHT34_01700 [Clostridia bacterium]|nr:hypothetical protein [Clostridia bacterium]
MSTNKILKIAGLNIGIAALDTILFSPGFIGINIGGTSVFATAFGCSAIFMSIALFVYGNYKILTHKGKIIQASEIKTEEDYINALKQNRTIKTFGQDIEIILEQIERLHKKNDTIRDILLQKFNREEMSYKKFNDAISAVENVFFMNIRSILNKINAFDEDDYMLIMKKSAGKVFSQEIIQTKMTIYTEYISFVKNSTEENEQILLKLDKLLLEISKFNSLEDGEIENLSGMKEIDELTKQAKYYK